VQVGAGDAPAKLVKHVPKVQMDSGASPAKLIKHAK